MLIWAASLPRPRCACGRPARTAFLGGAAIRVGCARLMCADRLAARCSAETEAKDRGRRISFAFVAWASVAPAQEAA